MVSLKEFKLRAFVSESESLAKFGFNPLEKISSLKDFSQQMESHALHVIEDRPVSNAYSYFIDNKGIYLDKEKKTKLFIDPEERGGLSLMGIKETVRKALLHSGQIIFLYSPPGIVAFERGTRYDKMKPYPDGQLYLLVGKDDNQVDAMAISVSKEEEKQVLSTFLGKKNLNYGGFDDEIEKIKYFLTNPAISKLDIDGLLTYLEGVSYLKDFLVYENVHHEKFFLSDVLHDLYLGWQKEIKPKIEINYQELFYMAREGNVRGAYTNQLQNPAYIYLYGDKNGNIPLGGGCGGNNNENEFDTSKDFMKIDPLSTNYRLSTPSIQDILNGKDNEDRYKDYHCPECGTEIKGEIKGSDPSTWVKKCNCGFQFNCN